MRRAVLLLTGVLVLGGTSISAAQSLAPTPSPVTTSAAPRPMESSLEQPVEDRSGLAIGLALIVAAGAFGGAAVVVRSGRRAARRPAAR